MSEFDEYAAQVSRALAVVANAVAADLENAGIDAETTRQVALTYQQAYLEQRGTASIHSVKGTES